MTIAKQSETIGVRTIVPVKGRKPMCDRPMAAPGLISYRYPSGFTGYAGSMIMIGAKDDADALREANRSLRYPDAMMALLERWDADAGRYVPAQKLSRAEPVGVVGEVILAWNFYPLVRGSDPIIGRVFAIGQFPAYAATYPQLISGPTGDLLLR